MVASGCVEAGSGFQARVTLGLRGCYETRCRRSAARILCPTPTRGLTAPATFIPPLRGWIDSIVNLFVPPGRVRAEFRNSLYALGAPPFSPLFGERVGAEPPLLTAHPPNVTGIPTSFNRSGSPMRSRFLPVHSDSISTTPSTPVA